MADLLEWVIPRIMDQWEEFADALHYETPITQSIKQKQHYDPQKCCRELFKDWLVSDRGDKPKEWSTVLKKLKEIGLEEGIIEEIATNVMELHKS